jgi:hypothetical protein
MRCNNCCNMGCKHRFTPVRIVQEFNQTPKLYIGNRIINPLSDYYRKSTDVPGNHIVKFNGVTFEFHFNCKYLPEGV